MLLSPSGASAKTLEKARPISRNAKTVLALPVGPAARPRDGYGFATLCLDSAFPIASKGCRSMAVSTWRAQRNEKARVRLMRDLPEVFPRAVLVHALSRSFLPATPRRTVDSYWRYHPVRADKLARALAALSGAPKGWVWRVGIQKSGPPVSFRAPPTPFREPAYTKGPGHCCACGQPIFRFGWHRDLWGDGRPNQNATWHSCCVAAWNLWIAPSDHVRHLKVLQKRRCLATGERLLKNAEVDHHVPLFKVWRDYRDRPWPALLAFWGVPNLQVINRSAHVEKCAQEAGERRVRVIPAIADRSPQTVYRPEGSSPVLSVSLSCAAQA
jgi:hypothetical protein